MPASHLRLGSHLRSHSPVALGVPAGSVTFYAPNMQHRVRANTLRGERHFLGLTVLARGGVVPSGIPYAIEASDVGKWQLARGMLMPVAHPHDR